jgi:DNA-binding transcriptional regulator GbsR (MarR family)
VLEKQTQEIAKLKEWLEKNSANNNDEEDREGFQNYIEQNNDTLGSMKNNLSYIQWKLDMMNILLEDGEEEDEDEMIESEYRVIEFY